MCYHLVGPVVLQKRGTTRLLIKHCTQELPQWAESSTLAANAALQRDKRPESVTFDPAARVGGVDVPDEASRCPGSGVGDAERAT